METIQESDDENIRKSAEAALDAIGYVPASEEEKIAYFIVRSFWKKLIEIGEPAVEPLIKSLKNTDVVVRRGAAETLGEMAIERAVEPLIDALKDEHATVRYRAAKSLGQIRDKRAVGPLNEALQDSDSSVRNWAEWSLKEIKNK